jgi:hypothetical protein
VNEIVFALADVRMEANMAPALVNWSSSLFSLANVAILKKARVGNVW